MSQLIRSARSAALFRVTGKSDFWIQRTNPYEPGFADDDMYRDIREVLERIWPEHAGKLDGIIRSAVMSAMDREKSERIRRMKWDPYGVHDPSGPGTAYTG